MTDLAEFAREKGVKYFMVSYTDLMGAQRAKLVPAYTINNVVKGGAGFAGFAGGFVLTPAHPDMLGVPEPSTVIQLPWKPEVAWVAANPAMYDSPLPQAPRNVLRNVVADAEKVGLRIKTGVEPEFFFLSPCGGQIADTFDKSAKPCYDQQAIMRRYDVISEVSDYMIDLGWEPYQSDHEDANGQFEMNWKYDDALNTADKLAFFKFMLKSVAEKHGLRVTFMPKPFLELTGSGMHAHISGWSLDGQTNAFYDGNDELGLSEVGHHFLGGIMKHASSLAAITNPTINSYKRINAPRTSSGATWAPNSVTWSGDNRTHLVRVPGKGRIELRLPDGASNPYLLQAVIMAAGIDGVRNKCDPGKRLDIDMYAEGHLIKDAPKLPLNLLDAIRTFDGNAELKAALGNDFSKAFIERKMKEWNSYSSHLTQWERDNTLDI